MKRGILFLLALVWLGAAPSDAASYYYGYSSGTHYTSSDYNTIYTSPVFRDDTSLMDSDKFFEIVGRDHKKYDSYRGGRPHAPREESPSSR